MPTAMLVHPIACACHHTRCTPPSVHVCGLVPCPRKNRVLIKLLYKKSTSDKLEELPAHSQASCTWHRSVRWSPAFVGLGCSRRSKPFFSDRLLVKRIAVIQKILKLLPTSKREIDENGKVRIKFRIDDVSKNHMVSARAVQSDFTMLFARATSRVYIVRCCIFAEAALPSAGHTKSTRAVAERRFLARRRCQQRRERAV